MVINDFSKYNNQELIMFYREWIKELRNRKIIRTDNIVGEIGEYLAINYYNSNKILPDLEYTKISSENIDAISKDEKKEKYSIKTITTRNTGSFFGIESKENKIFDKLIIVELDKNFNLKRIIEIEWDIFWKYKKWHNRNKAYFISINKDLLNDAEVRYQKEVGDFL